MGMLTLRPTKPVSVLVLNSAPERGHVVAGLGVDGREVAGARDLDILARGLGGLLGGDDAVVVGQRRLRPDVDVVRLRRRQRQPVAEAWRAGIDTGPMMRRRASQALSRPFSP
jgi:hypothetical protein